MLARRLPCHAEFSTRICSLAAFGGIWRHLAALGGIWRHLAAFGGIWRHLAAFGGIWRHLAAFRLYSNGKPYSERHRQTANMNAEQPRPNEFTDITRAVRAMPNGARFSEILAHINGAGVDSTSERTLSRRLHKLVEAGRLHAVGNASGRRYFATTAAEPETTATTPTSPGLPLSNEGRNALFNTRQPIAQRRVIGYREAWLRSYVPQSSDFLDEATRNRLNQLGGTTDVSRPAGTFARDILERLLIDLSWASSRLEGNTYSRIETIELLHDGKIAAGKGAVETQMILNHKKAIEMLVDQAEDIGFNRYTLFNLHATLSENLLGDRKDEGRIRQHPVSITGTTYLPLAIPQKLEELFDHLLSIAGAIADPFEQAFFVMVHIPYLQPFADVNKRTSRLAANISLIKSNLCPLSFIDLPDDLYAAANIAVYEFNDVSLLRDLFVWAYERSAQQYRIVKESLPQPDPIRQRYRQQIVAFVHATVTGRQSDSDATIRAWADAHDVPVEDLGAFVHEARQSLTALHDGAIQRYGIRLSQFNEWKNR